MKVRLAKNRKGLYLQYGLYVLKKTEAYNLKNNEKLQHPFFERATNSGELLQANQHIHCKNTCY
jgi:hypothetical protein